MAAAGRVSRLFFGRKPSICLKGLRIWQATRYNSSLVNLDIKDNVAVMELNRKPVNSFSLEFIEEISISLAGLEQNKNVRGLILTSGLSNVFSAGLDLIHEILNANPERLNIYWRSFREMFIQLYGSRLVTIAAVNGHAIAGGCVLASACDYRVMASNFTIGLNETVAGVVVPQWVSKTLINLIGYREGEHASMLGIMFPSDVAMAKGLVDKVVPQEQVITEAEEEMAKWLAIPDLGRVLTKQNLRRDFIQKMKDTMEQDVEAFVEYILKESTQSSVQEQVDRMKKKSKK